MIGSPARELFADSLGEAGFFSIVAVFERDRERCGRRWMELLGVVV